VCSRKRVWIPPASGAVEHIAQRRHLSDEALLVHIGAGLFGEPWSLRLARNLAAKLRRQSICVGKLRAAAADAAKHAFRPAASGVSSVSTTDSRHDYRSHRIGFDRNLHRGRTQPGWVGDITYIATEEGWLFLAVVIDLFSRKVWLVDAARHASRSL